MATPPASGEEADNDFPAIPEYNKESNSGIKKPPHSTDDCLIMALNTDCLLKIFDYLPIVDIVAVDKVCLQWRRALDSLWRTYTAMDCTDFHYSTVRGYILKRCGPWLKKIECPPLYELTPSISFLKIILENCPKIEHVVLERTALASSDGFDLLFYRFLKQIKSIEIDDRSVCHSFLEKIFKNLYRLEALSFNCKQAKYCYDLLMAISFLPNTIKKINFGFIEEINAKFFTILRSHCPNLEVLQLKTNVDVEELSHEIIKFTKLKELSLLNPCLNVDSAHQFLSLSQLVKLEFPQTEELNDDYLGKIAESLPNLRHLDIQSVMSIFLTDVGVKKLAKLKHLEHLNLSYLCGVSSTGIAPVAANGKLKELILISTKVKDDVVPKVVAPCPYLKILDLSSCDSITLKIHSRLSEVFNPGNNRALLKVFTGGSKYVMVHGEELEDDKVDTLPAKVTYPNLLIHTDINNVDIRLQRGRVFFDNSDDDFSDLDIDDAYDDYDSDYSCLDEEWFDYDDPYIHYEYQMDDVSDIAHEMWQLNCTEENGFENPNPTDNDEEDLSDLFLLP